MKEIKRAMHDTFVGRSGRAVFLIVGGSIASYSGVYFMLGGKEAMLELPFIYAGLWGAFAPLMLLFLWNLACAPYRIQRDRADEFEAKYLKLTSSRSNGYTLLARLMDEGENIQSEFAQGSELIENAEKWSEKVKSALSDTYGEVEVIRFASAAGKTSGIVVVPGSKLSKQIWQWMGRRLERLEKILSKKTVPKA